MDTPKPGTSLDADLALLAAAMAAAHTQREAEVFLADLCTPREITELARRIRVARLLAAGRTYTQVQRETGASSTTVSRVSRSLNSGNGGYQAVLAGLDTDA